MSPSERSLFRRPAVLSRFPASAVIMVTAPESPRSHPDHDQELPVQQYLLILRENPAAFEHISPAEMQAIVERYVAWGHSLAERGVMAGGIKLADVGGRHVRTVGVTDGPYAETKEVVGGFFEVLAEDYDGAVALAQECPHLDYGWIEVRRVETTP